MSGFGLELWQRLAAPESAGLISAVSELDLKDGLHPNTIEKLRRSWDRELIPVAIELVRARAKARGKFPNGDELWADVEGVEQATSRAVAEHKAERFRKLAPEQIYDLCCGIGGDGMSLAGVAEVVAVDNDPVRAWMAERNVGCSSRCEDVTELDLRDAVFHMDPSRRGEGRRAWKYRDYRPSPDVIARLLEANGDGAVKLGPGVDFDALPAGGEVEVINENGALVQAVLWRGRLTENEGFRTATRIDRDGAIESITGRPSSPPVEPSGGPSSWLVVADPAIERAELLGELCNGRNLAEWTPGLGLLTSSHKPSSTWCCCFEVLEVMPWRLESVRDWLRARDCATTEVKTRGGAVDPDSIRFALVGSGSNAFTVWVLRWASKIHAVITSCRS